MLSSRRACSDESTTPRSTPGPDTNTTEKPADMLSSVTLKVGPHAPASQTAHVAPTSAFIRCATAEVQRCLLSTYWALVVGRGSDMSFPSSTVAFLAEYVTVPGDMYAEEPLLAIRAACMIPPVVLSKTETVCPAAFSRSDASSARGASGPGTTGGAAAVLKVAIWESGSSRSSTQQEV
eukprot:4430756-Prymnesium_polylepis.1